MSRLYDRILAFGCQPMYPHHLYTAENWQEHRERIYEHFVRENASEFETEAELVQAARYVSSHQAQVSNGPRAVESLDIARLADLPVIAADEVGTYCEALPAETQVQDVLSVLAPPFDAFFVEVQGVENSLGLNAWGALIGQTFSPGPRSEDSEIGWHLTVELVIERGKNKPIGPVVTFIFALDREGRLMENPDEPGHLISAIIPPKMNEDPPSDVQQDIGNRTMPFALALLMAVSFMHCRNVSSSTVEQPERQSRSWQKKRGHPLTRYEVLEIDPLRELLKSEGYSDSKGLEHALHVCRGHFKTYTEEAPLFGRTTGTFWWADQVRGNADAGEIKKDYEVSAGDSSVRALGREYRTADESPVLEQQEHSGPDPDAAGRGLAAHNRTQNLLARAVEGAGLRPRSPAPDEPRYDLGWAAPEQLWVAEVKSITERNEERQLRMALGQVVRYRHQLGRDGGDVQALIAVEREPYDASWIDLCNEQGVILCWPETMELAVRAGLAPNSL